MRSARLALLLAALGLCSCLGPARSGDLPELVGRELDAPHVLGVVELKAPHRNFNSISGMAFDGNQITAITDLGHWLRFRLEVDGEGRPVSASGLEIGRLGGLEGGKSDSDAEDLVLTPEGWLVSFERRHRLMLYPGGLDGRAVPLDMPQGFTRQPGNGGVEAITRLADGRLLMLSEDGVNQDDTGWGWVGRPGAWDSLRYQRDGDFRPSAATTLPDGDVLVAQRSFTLLGGFGFRLVRIARNDIRPGALLAGREIMRLRSPQLVDNYEAIAVHPRADGRLVAYILSDDNTNPFQATLLMAVLLPD
jgi:hypothetical protein